jgi:ArsR family transcriptional regulator
MDIAPNLLSYHLKILREAGLIVGTKRGRWIDYAIAPDAAEVVSEALPGRIAG